MKHFMVIICSLLSGVKGAPVNPPAPVPPPSVWITLDYPSSAKILTSDEVKDFLFTIQHTGDSRFPLSINDPRWIDIEWSIRTLAISDGNRIETEGKGTEKHLRPMNNEANEYKGNEAKEYKGNDFDESDDTKENANTSYSRERRRLLDVKLKETVLFTLPPKSDVGAEKEAILVQLFYDYRGVDGELQMDIETIGTGLTSFVEDIWGTSYPIFIMHRKADSYSLTQDCRPAVCKPSTAPLQMKATTQNDQQ